MKTRDAEIVFISRICDPGQSRQQQKTTAVLQGRVGRSGSSLYLVFSAEIADVGPADYTIRVSGKEALIIRKGASPMRQPLMIGQTMTGTYGTQIGHMETKATTEIIDSDTSDDSGVVRLVYDLSVAGQSVGKVMLDYRYKIG
ncbi:DUF1934 domain-containing protein [Sporolactobacillus nakayamae]|uniref:Uncharacterized beta-barrel protein YwiB, DUF1934 family n=1 Tax=Sporolactobacillus nakayamae TaxID=269670 RepID=A0A1I2QBW5_9BACL|nr:DUF1934 domain-containing protein [Sporolactobacillus nakayamae]SFG23276.1 Uncharacterized beta-barrel protein YwiB, DUF1934 family [Sporolactobacillus nakayamae]